MIDTGQTLSPIERWELIERRKRRNKINEPIHAQIRQLRKQLLDCPSGEEEAIQQSIDNLKTQLIEL